MAVATLRRLLVARARRLEVDHQVQQARFVGASESALRVAVATPAAFWNDVRAASRSIARFNPPFS